MNLDFWRGKKVFITGHTGFKGSWLALWLQRRGAIVTGYALAPAEKSLFIAAAVADDMASVIGDIRDFEALSATMRLTEPEVVFHLAAQPLVRASYNNPVGTYEVNVMGTVHVLEAIRQTPSVRATVIVTSDKCYENNDTTRGFREDDPMGGSDPYSSSKGCTELVTAAYRRSYFDENRVALASVRAGNVIGGGDWSEDRLVPDLVRAFSAGEPVRLRYPQAVRPWQHVLEPLRGYLTVAEYLSDGGTDFARGWNLGPNEEDAWTVAQVVSTVAGIWGESVTWETDNVVYAHEAKFLTLDCTLARTNLGWTPCLPLQEGLELAVDWYKAYLRGEDMKQYTLNQIAVYEDIIATAPQAHNRMIGAIGE